MLAGWCRVALGSGATLPESREDDPDLARILIANKLAPSLAAALRRRGSGASPLAALLSAEAVSVAQSSLGSLHSLRDVARSLDDAGVPWMLWKGPALALQAWGGVGFRAFSDLDVVVSRADREPARSALLAAGWRSRHGLSRRQELAILSGSGALEMERSADEPPLELHWRFASPRFPSPFDVAEVMARAESIGVAGIDILTPGGADALLLLAMHGTKHGWSQAEEVLTFTRLAWRDPAAVEDAVRLAIASRRVMPLGLALALAERLAGLELHSASRELAHDPRVAGLADRCIPRMCAGDAGWRPDNAWSMAWMDLRADRLQYLRRALLSPTMEEWKWVRLPDPIVAAYPAVRLARLALRVVSPRR